MSSSRCRVSMLLVSDTCMHHLAGRGSPQLAVTGHRAGGPAPAGVSSGGPCACAPTASPRCSRRPLATARTAPRASSHASTASSLSGMSGGAAFVLLPRGLSAEGSPEVSCFAQLMLHAHSLRLFRCQTSLEHGGPCVLVCVGIIVPPCMSGGIAIAVLPCSLAAEGTPDVEESRAANASCF